MKIRIYETDFEGHPVEYTGEYFAGSTPLAIVEAMKMNPFNAGLDPQQFMRKILDGIGQKDFPLVGDPGKDAIAFLQRLTALNYAEYVLEPEELISEPLKKSHIAHLKNSK